MKLKLKTWINILFLSLPAIIFVLFGILMFGCCVLQDFIEWSFPKQILLGVQFILDIKWQALRAFGIFQVISIIGYFWAFKDKGDKKK